MSEVQGTVMPRYYSRSEHQDRLIGVASHEILEEGTHWWGDSYYSAYCNWYPMNGWWCAMFVSWCFEQAGLSSIILKHSLTTAGRRWFIDQGRWSDGSAGIKRGDVIYFKNAGGNANIVNHVGIVERVDPSGKIHTIEGNTKGDLHGVSTGGTVARKQYDPWERRIIGYGSPAYGSVVDDSERPSRPSRDGDRGRYLVADGHWGTQTTLALQNRFGTYADGEIWGQYSAHKAKNPGLKGGWVWSSNPKGSPLIKSMQSWLGVGADGIAGPGTFSALQRRLGMKYVDGVLWTRSPAIATMQNRLNSGSL